MKIARIWLVALMADKRWRSRWRKEAINGGVLVLEISYGLDWSLVGGKLSMARHNWQLAS